MQGTIQHFAPWTYDYSPYSLADGQELPAFTIYDAQGNKVFDTNEDSPMDQQEANARLASAAPELHAALRECVRLLADYEDLAGEEGEAYQRGVDALALALFGSTTTEGV